MHTRACYETHTRWVNEHGRDVKRKNENDLRDAPVCFGWSHRFSRSTCCLLCCTLSVQKLQGFKSPKRNLSQDHITHEKTALLNWRPLLMTWLFFFSLFLFLFSSGVFCFVAPAIFQHVCAFKAQFSHSRNVNWMLKYANYIIVWWRFMFHTSNLENKAEQQKKIRPMMESNNNYGTKYAWAESTQKKQKKKSTKHTQRLNSTN